MQAIQTHALFDLSKTLAADYLAASLYPWEALAGLAEEIRRLGAALPEGEYRQTAKEVWIARDAAVASTAVLGGPCIIGHGAELRHCAFVRGSALVGAGVVVGNSTELKNCILFDGVQVPHYNYIGDSVLGHRAHFGAGAVTSNVKSDRSEVVIRADGKEFTTGRYKVGAFVGDRGEIGCNAVLCPGAVIGRGSIVYPLTMVRGFVPEGRICKRDGRLSERM